jgi:cytochrome c
MVLRFIAAVVCAILGVNSPARAETLQDAAKAGNVDEIRLLLSQGANINGDSHLATPLFYAIQNHHEKAALALIKLGADVSAMSIWGTPLHAAAAADMPMAVAWMIGYGADPNARWKQLTPLHIAARDGHATVVRVLLDRGADSGALTMFDEPPLHLAVRNGHAEVADLLREQGTSAPEVDEIDRLLPTADVTRGKALALPCGKCHTSDRAGAVTTGCTGGPLWNIVNRPKAQDGPEFSEFSPALEATGGVWTYHDLNRFLAQPAWTVPGTSMRMQGIHDARDRADLIAYLRTLSDQPAPLP